MDAEINGADREWAEFMFRSLVGHDKTSRSSRGSPRPAAESALESDQSESTYTAPPAFADRAQRPGISALSPCGAPKAQGPLEVVARAA